MTFFKSCAIALSMYSRIPMPQFPWEKKEMKWAICFFPVVGFIIAIVLSFWLWLSDRTAMPGIAQLMIGCLVPVLVSGGIHIDGFMDTQDAISSYRTMEERLKILKDPHSGAFSIISLLVYAVLYGAFVFTLPGEFQPLWAVSFILSRVLSGLSVVTFKNAGGSGSLMAFQEETDRSRAVGIFVAELCGLIFILFIMGLSHGFYFLAASVVMVWSAALAFLFYRYRSYKLFGGITGDLAGWFLCLCELVQIGALTAFSLIF